MNLKIYSTTVCRTPLFPYNTNIHDVWDELKEAIKISSSDFYTLIKDVSADELPTLDPRIKFACWKYFNRACFRATPFGPFGSITLLPLADQQGARIADKPHIKHFIDWSHKDQLSNSTDELYEQAHYLLSNSTIYFAGEQLRYLNVNQDNIFELSSIERQTIIEEVLRLCKTPAKKDKAIHLLLTQYQLQSEIAADLLKQLIELQLLITDRHPNIIGEDYFKRVTFSPQSISLPYSISERTWIDGSLNKKELAVVPEALQFLSKHLAETTSLPLSAFKLQFQTKFEYKEVPLLLALDPELGLGYDDLEVFSTEGDLIETLRSEEPRSAKPPQVPYSPLHQMLLNGMLQKQDFIQLEELEQFEVKTAHNTEFAIPNTLSAIIQFTQEHLILEEAGGVTATALLGRFTLENQAMTDYCRSIATVEQEANPDIIFFDIAYQAEKKIDNVNRRVPIYAYELTLLSWPSDNKQLSLSDIMISVKNNEIILRSKTFQKRLIPRLTSAYNYKRSDLSLYRFLCDLQYQHLQSSFSANLRQLFPNLIYYPRISYKNLIISPRMWKVPKQFQQTHQKSTIFELKKWLRNCHVSDTFKFGQNDQFLQFDSNKDEELLFFLQHIKGKETTYITEAFTPRKMTLTDSSGTSYAGQYILQLYHREPLFRPAPAEHHELHRESKSLILPGNNWLYAEIYIHPSRSNNLLIETLSFYLKSLSKELKSWFFIRYTIPSSHIRLRVQLKEGSSFQAALSRLTALLEKDVRVGIVSDLQIKPYLRETERYGLNEIEQVEKHFWLESRYSLLLIQQQADEFYIYALVIRFMSDLLKSLKLDFPRQLSFVKEIAKSFAKEMNISTKGFKKINESFISFQKQASPHVSRKLEKEYQKMLLHTITFLSSQASSKQLQLLRDFIHMHVNRLFTTDQRMHELVIYQFCQKLLTTSQKRSIPSV